MGSRLFVNKVCRETHACFVFDILRGDRRFSQQMLLINIFCNTIGTMPDNVTKSKKKKKKKNKKKKHYMYFDPSMSHHQVAIADVLFNII